MNERSRVALAFALSLAVMLVWQYYFAPPPPPGNPASTPGGGATPVADLPAGTASLSSQAGMAPTDAPARDITVETPLWRATFSNRGGVLTRFILKALPNGRTLRAGDGKSELEVLTTTSRRGDPGATTTELGAAFELRLPDNAELTDYLNRSRYQVEGVAEDTLTVTDGQTATLAFTLTGERGYRVAKRYVIRGGRYDFDFVAELTKDGAPQPLAFRVGPNFGDQAFAEYDGYTHTPPQAVTVVGGNAVFTSFSSITATPPDAEKPVYLAKPNTAWCALTDHYFAFAAIPPAPGVVQLSRRDATTRFQGRDIKREYAFLDVPTSSGANNIIYIGPKDRTYLASVSRLLKTERGLDIDLRELNDYGWLAFFVRPLIPALDWLLRFFYAQTQNYGWAIVLLTFVVNMLLFPLRWKTAVSFRKVAVHAPRHKELAERLKRLQEQKVRMDDPRMLELQREQLQLMKDSLPIMGCLPLLLQLPIFVAIYVYLQLSIDLRQAPFIGWLTDLSAPDPWHILPVVLCVTQIGQSYLMPQPPGPEDPAVAMQRKIIVWVMPIVFAALFFWSAPSGLVVYWMAGNIVGITQQLIINRMLPPLPTAETPAGAAPTGGAADGKGKKKFNPRPA
ncbi:MAG: membrane protein insertase YidC [Chloracidobacterium sp.]|nr:membrane protein insertase YidC [Chloracidobacterium sp.]MDW8217071.1 membrane protein insertase YidC [Acidobacteriota bacterium]